MTVGVSCAGRRRAVGSASVEFAFVVPFVLALTGAVWDIHEHIGLRTEMAREIYAAAEAATRGDLKSTTVLVDVIVQLGNRLGQDPDVRDVSKSGAIRAAVVTRGDTRHDGTTCPPAAVGTLPPWCPPYVTTPPPGSVTPRVVWSHDGSACTATSSTLPAPSTHFAAMERLLPGEGNSQPTEADWPSRRLAPDQWWLVIDVCIEPKPGFFVGRLTDLPLRLLNASPVMQRRYVWGSVDDLPDCDWCGTGP